MDRVPPDCLLEHCFGRIATCVDASKLQFGERPVPKLMYGALIRIKEM
jgi:hypothetical protein